MMNYSPESVNGAVESRYLEYNELRGEYIRLCDKYGFSPRELSLFLMGARKLVPGDKQRLVKLIVKVSRMEQELSGLVQDCLFANNETEYENSEIFS